MNERIRELAIQIMHSDPAPHLTTELYSFTKSEFEKFAELIVGECIKELENDTRCRIAGADKIVAKHFGVEK